MTTRLFTLIGALAAVAVWGANTSPLLEMTRVGEMSMLVFLLFVAAVVALVVGALRLQFGKMDGYRSHCTSCSRAAGRG